MDTTFRKLERFLLKEMSMSHVYQPAMLLELLRSEGRASVDQIAKALLLLDASQVEYYQQITKNMVGRVLSKNRGLTERKGNEFQLKDFESLSAEEVIQLQSYCLQKIDEYIAKRGDAIWSHRRKSSGYVSGTARYEILKRAKFRCELCGVSADQKALEVDHILPRNRGGGDEIHNLQALCYSCNSSKRDKDDTDFRGVAQEYARRQEGCVFCELPSDRVVGENELAVAFLDAYPVTEGHTLVIPKRHVEDYFGLFQPELNAINALLAAQRHRLKEGDSSISAFNVGVNSGEAAGQTIFHCHVHLIPRRAGDVKEPRGGVRGVIPKKQSY